MVRSSTLGYIVLLSISLVVVYLQGRLVEVFVPAGTGALMTHALIGVLMAGLVVSGSSALRGTFLWARRLEEEFRLLLVPLTLPDALILSVSSGFVEELFFRAVLQGSLGLWPTSILFGLLHYPMNRRMIPWTGMATLLGLVFGVVYDRTDSLLAVALAHGLINFVELIRLVRAPSGRPESTP